MAAVLDDDYDSPAVRQALRRERDERRSRIRSHWWYPLLVLLITVSGLWGVIKADQLIAEDLIWPGAGAQFVEVGPVPTDPDATGGRIVVVVAGLNRKSGTGVAAALMPSLTVGQTRVFSLVYGSGINDQDILDKYNGLLNRYQPREISFFGSSMGGDVVLALAAHTQELRDQYRLTLQSAAVDSIADGALAGAGIADGALAGAGIADGALGSDGVADAAAVDPVLATPAPAPAAPSAPVNGPGTNAGAAQPGSGPATASTAPSSSTRPAGSVGAELATGRLPVGAQAARITDLFTPAPGLGTAVGAAMAQFGSSAGPAAATADEPPAEVVPPRLGTIYLDCSPLGAADVRDASRTQADLLTGTVEALGTEGGAVVRLTAEVLAQREQWSTGAFPFLQVRYDDLKFKFDQVMREKISGPGISTQLIRDQYGVIRRTDIEDITDALGPGTRIVYFLPENRSDDRTILVDQVEATLLRLATDKRLDVRIVPIPGGHHASAESNSDEYRRALDHLSGTAS